MLEPNAAGAGQQTGTPPQQTPPAEAFTPQSMEDMIANSQKAFPQQVPIADGASETESALAAELTAMKFQKWLDDGKQVFGRELPDSSEDQKQQAMEALAGMDIGELVRVIKNAVQQSIEKEEKSDAGEALQVEGNSTATPPTSGTTAAEKTKGFLDGLTGALGLSS